MLLVKNARILTMTGVDYNNGYIAAEGEKITALGDDTAELARLEAAASEVIDAKGCHVLPGFVDAHCHVGMWEDSVGFEGDDGNETSTLSCLIACVDASIMRTGLCWGRENGVTTVVWDQALNVISGQFAARKRIAAESRIC